MVIPIPKSLFPHKQRSVLAIKDNTKRPNSITWHETIQIGDKTVTLKIDTGSDVNLISNDIFRKLRPKFKLTPSSIKLSSYSGHLINILGTSDVKCSKNNKEQTVKFFVTCLNADSVLGLQACLDFGIVAKLPSPVEVHSAEKTIKVFADVFNPPEILKCKSYHISLLPKAKFSQVNCRKVTTPLKLKLKAELQRMIENGILEPANDTVGHWIHPAIVAKNNNEALKIYMDCRALNKFVVADHQPMPLIEDLLQNIKGSQYFSILTAPQGFMQIPIREPSSKLCTIDTPCGRFKFKTIPYGFSRACEIYHTIANQIFDGLEGVLVHADDILVHGKTNDEHNSRLVHLLERARKYNLKFSKAKLQLAKTEIRFLGYILSKNGFSVDASKFEAIETMAVPINKQELQRFFNMISNLGATIPNFSLHAEPLKKLLKREDKFIWGKDQDMAFSNLKNLICEPPTIKLFNPNKPLYISVAASSFGIGAVAMQDGQPLSYFSTALNNVQQKFPQIEKKLYAILCGLERFHYYTYGKEVIVQSDHRPLLTVIKEPIELMSPKLQKIMLKLMRFSLRLEYVAGKDLAIPYALCRHPLKQTSLDYPLEAKPVPAHSLLCATDERIDDFKQSLKEDPVLQNVISFIKEGWPKYPSWIKTEARKYFNIKEDLHYTGELLFCGNRLVVPHKEKQKVLKQIHNAHQSLKSCQQKANSIYYWPTMVKDIEIYIANCIICQRDTKSIINNQIFHQEMMPELPWNKLGISFVHVDRRDYVMVVDYFSSFLIIRPVNVKTAKALTNVLEDVFSTHGLPLEIVSDSAPPFNTPDWKNFLKTYDIKHIMFVDSNSDSTFIQRHVQISKSFIKKSINSNMGLFLAILEYNSTPKHSLPSPSELLMGRRLRTSLLVPKTMLVPNFDISKAVGTIKKGQEGLSKERVLKN